jgi:hypothetical protein
MPFDCRECLSLKILIASLAAPHNLSDDAGSMIRRF